MEPMEKVDKAAEVAIDAIQCWIVSAGAAISKVEKDAMKGQAIIALRKAILEAQR